MTSLLPPENAPGPSAPPERGKEWLTDRITTGTPTRAFAAFGPWPNAPMPS